MNGEKVKQWKVTRGKQVLGSFDERHDAEEFCCRVAGMDARAGARALKAAVPVLLTEVVDVYRYDDVDYCDRCGKGTRRLIEVIDEDRDVGYRDKQYVCTGCVEEAVGRPPQETELQAVAR
jgi:hypothetical protein